MSRKTSAVNIEQEEADTRTEENQKASLVASYFGPTPTNRSSSLKKINKPNAKVEERASYEPENDAYIDDDDDNDEIERLMKAAENERKDKRSPTASSSSSEAPPIPAR